MIAWMVQKTLNSNMELNLCRIIAFPNVNTKSPLEPAVDKQTWVDGIRS